MHGSFRTHSPYFISLKYILHTDVILEGDCYGKLAVYHKDGQESHPYSGQLSESGGQVQVGTFGDKVDKFG